MAERGDRSGPVARNLRAGCAHRHRPEELGGMRDVMAKMLVPALVGVAAVVPFAILEGVTLRGFPVGFPAALFGLLWLLSATFAFVLRTIVRDARAGQAILEHQAASR